MLYHKYIDTPIGRMRIGVTDKGICMFDYEKRDRTGRILTRIEAMAGLPFIEGEHPYIDLLEKQIEEYFEGKRKEFDLPLQLVGTPFQVSVWEGLMKIPYGITSSYKKQSITLGNEKAIRAMAHANGENSINIIVPCHRVIGANGSLVGYGGGLERKKWLLEHEQKHSGHSSQAQLF